MKKLYEGTLARQIKTELAKELHDEMGSALAVISSRIKIAKYKLASHDELQPEFFNKAELLVDSLLKSTRDFIWIVGSSDENPINLFYYLKDLGEELFDGADLRFIATMINHCEADKKLEIGQSYQIVLLLKEALTNIVKHSNCNNVELKLLVDSDKIVFQLKDDGNGFDSKVKDLNVVNSYGLKNMAERARKIGGHLNVLSKPGKGTSVKLELTSESILEQVETGFLPRQAS